jgi:hypothetical protein
MATYLFAHRGMPATEAHGGSVDVHEPFAAM